MLETGDPARPQLAGPEPAPGAHGGALTLAVTCRAAGSRRHRITIRNDWTVESPHDLDAERVARALGADGGCLRVIDDLLPVARRWLLLHCRVIPPDTTVVAGGWRPMVMRRGCCPFARGTWCASDAAEHARDSAHLAAVSGVSRRALRGVVDRLAPARDRYIEVLQQSPEWSAAGMRVTQGGLDELWRAGVHPSRIVHIHEQVARPDVRFGPSFYLNVLAHRPNLGWVASSLSATAVDDADRVGCWLAASETDVDRSHPDVRRAWLSLGLPPRLIQELTTASYLPHDVTCLAARCGSTTMAAAVALARWVQAGCQPTVDALLRLRAHGLPVAPHNFSAAVVERLQELLRGDGDVSSATDCGLLFAAAGSVPMARAWVRAGRTDPYDIARRIADGQTPTVGSGV